MHPQPSRLQKTVHQVSVAELVQKYQDYLPAQGVQELAQTALAPRPLVSESEQDYPSQATVQPAIVRNRTRHRVPIRKPSTSDFEQGYAANAAPRRGTHSRKSLISSGSRIPVLGKALESRGSSRLSSPDRRHVLSKDNHPSRPSSPHGEKPIHPSLKLTKSRIVSRSKDKQPTRTPGTPGNKMTFRRPALTMGSKVPAMARHYERLGREAERSRSKYAVIRSRPARPVVYAPAKVKVLDSVKEAIADDTESSDSSSEADDEADGNDEERPISPTMQREPLMPDPATSSVVSEPIPEPLSETAPHIASENVTTSLQAPINLEIQKAEKATRLLPPGQITLPSPPFLKNVKSNQEMARTPTSDSELGTERISFLKALSVFWQQPTRSSIEADDPTSDPEHIFRDSSMVVRLDEPTSIIALALK